MSQRSKEKAPEPPVPAPEEADEDLIETARGAPDRGTTPSAPEPKKKD